MSERYIKTYLEENSVVPVPTDVEEDRPFSAIDVVAPNWKTPGSAARHNKNEAAFYEDYKYLEKVLMNISESLETSHRASSSFLKGLHSRLLETEMMFSRLLLLLGLQDQFVYGVDENFSTHTYVDLSNTTATVETDYVTLGRPARTLVRVNLTATAKGDVRTTLSTGKLSEIQDGWTFDIIGGKATAVITADFRKKTYVSDVKISSDVEADVQVFYSKDGKKYTQVSETKIIVGDNTLIIGQEDVLKIRLVFSNEQNSFSFTRMDFYGDKFSTSSLLYLGGYEIKDELGSPVNFTQAKLTACLETPPRTSVSFSLSKDGQNWTQAQGVVNLARTTDSNPTYITTDVVQEGLVVDREDLEYGKEALLNRYIDKDFSSLLVKRNIPQQDVELYGTKSGWFFDGEYYCTFYVSSPEGVILNFGDTSATLNGQKISGEVHIPQGYHKIRTGNWHDVKAGAKSDGQLQMLDPLYPYNHKLMIEGYAYPTDFSGIQIYPGMDEYFGDLLTEVAPEVFADSGADLGIYTLLDEKYIKVKLDPSDPSYQQERFQVEYLVRADSGNTLYVKAELRSYDSKYSPIVKSINIRVV